MENLVFYISIDANMVRWGEWNLGSIIQKENGDIEAQMTCNHKGYPNPMAVEAQAVTNTLMVSRLLGLRKIIVLTDYENIVTKVEALI